MAKRYDHAAIEKKWQRIWDEKELFKAEIEPDKPKYYILDMFPYPSGAGLHVGHVTGYTATDILARYKRQCGFNVLHPMGWDSFGLPAEQYAIRTGTHPAETTRANIDTYKRQLKSLGLSYDWSREIATTDTDYYKWTQWIFTKLYEKGLAYEAEMLVNYCPSLGTVLSNEEVENGHSVEGGYPVERRPLRQWILKITAYAERLLQDLDTLDWPDYLKKMQRNWIGKSEGALLYFTEEKTGETISTYTTSPQTLFGITYIVLSPEHPLVSKITSNTQKSAIDAYRKASAMKSDMDRTELAKEKTGVWTGAYVKTPIGEKVPVWIADYVLMGYGTGAVMGVPCNDERDFDFAKRFSIPIIQVIDPDIENHPDEATLKQILNCEVCWPHHSGTISNSSQGDLNLNGLSWSGAIPDTCDWLEKHKLGKRTTNYKLRDWLFSRQRYWGEPVPILHFEDGSMRALELDELPLTSPEVTDYKPAGDGQSPLAKVHDWVNITDPKTGKEARRETNTMPQWAGSCWYYLRFCDPKNSEKAWSSEAEKYWLPVDMYVGGVEHAVLHLLYARFWHKVLYDCGYVSTPEPFQKLRNQGLVTAYAYKLPGGGYVAPDGVTEDDDGCVFEKTGQGVSKTLEKMSKSKLNGVSPDEIVEELGADSLRLYEMFMAPFDKEKLWNTDAVSGCRRFLNRFYELIISDKVTDETSEEALKLGHRLVKGVGEDIEKMFYNTAVAKMMEFINHFSPLKKYPRSVLRMATQVLYPFAPHIAEECWEILGEKESLTFHPFPKYDSKYLIDDVVTYVIQVSGKVRGRLELPLGLSEEELFESAKKEPNILKHLDNMQIIKRIYIPNKLLNVVVKPK